MTARRKLFTLAAIGWVALSVLAGLAIVIGDYMSTRSDARLLLELNQLPPGTPFVEFERRWGRPSRHLDDPDQVREWGPLQDPELISTSDLYLFFHRASFPYRYVCVYRHRTSGVVTRVTWMGM